LGRTQTTTVHVTTSRGDLIAAQVHTTVDATTDTELVDRLFVEDPARALNVVKSEDGEVVRVQVPVVYHDPSVELLALVLGDSHRHRELDERIALLQRMRTDDAAIPPYAKDFAVVYGPAGLRALLDRRAQKAIDEAKAEDEAREVERRRSELEGRVAELEKVREQHERRGRELERRALDLDGKAGAIDRARGELEHARGEIDRLRSEARRTMIAAAAAQAGAAAQQAAAAAAIKPAPEPEEERGERTTIGAAPDAPAPVLTPAPVLPAGMMAFEADAEPDATRPVPLDELDEIETSLARVAAEEQRISSDRISTDALDPPTAPKTAKASMPAISPHSRHEHTNSVDLHAPDDEVPVDMGDDGDEDDGHERQTRAVLEHVSASNGHHDAPEALEDADTGGASIVPAGADPLTTETRDLPDMQADAWLEKVAARDASSIAVDPQHGARLALVVGEQLARSLGGKLDIRVLLHRTRHYPMVVLVIGPPPALRVVSTAQIAIVPLDIANDAHRNVLGALAKTFELTIELIVRGRRIRRAKLNAPLSENVGYIMRAAEDHLRGLQSGGEGTPAYDRGRDLVLGAGFDMLGVEHSDAAEFRDDKLAQIDTAQNLRRAIAIARRFARPMREDYLVCTRGFPLPRWRELRRHVLESAVAWGLWMGPELAQVAVSEGLARSRRDLVVRLDHGFDKLKRHPSAFDIDEEAAEDNSKALAEEARGLGVDLPKKNGQSSSALTSEDMSAVSGSIGSTNTPPRGVATATPPRAVTPSKGVRESKPKTSVEDLLKQLDERERRVAAAVELCERGDPRAATPVINAVGKMSRAEAVRVLGMSVKFGDAAAPALTAGLRSSKSFLRHGCALALALLRTEDGTQAVVDLLMNEPTEIWREVARAIGQVGPTGLMPLASNFGRLGDRATPQLAERVAWAMAHIAVRGGKAAVETMANGQSVVAPVARQALALHGSAANDQVRVRPGGGDGSQIRDVTVNRAFSRRFFEALEAGLPEASADALAALDASSPMEMLDESDLIDDEDDAEQLDDSDLIQQ
jgi:hypothetical protein